jgi:hypothetical protein
MAFFEADAINALEFFHRVFGSSSGTPGTRRGGDSSPAASTGDRFFGAAPLRQIEALYLNLCFLEELSRLVFPRLGALQHPDLALSLEAIRISLNHEPARVPLLWNFAVEWIGAGNASEAGAAMPQKPPSYGIYFLGITQCAALMSRRHPSAASLAAAVAALVQTLVRHRNDAGRPLSEAEADRLFRSAVAAGGEAWPAPAAALCRQAFHLGIDLVAESLDGRSPSREALFNRLDQLKADAWRSLFGAAPPTQDASSGAHDAEIHVVLSGVLQRWRAAASAPGGTPDADLPLGGDDDPDRTVVLGRPHDGQKAVPEADPLTETVVLGGRGSAPPSGATQEADDAAPGTSERTADELAETVVVPPGGERPPPSERTADELPETVVVPPGGERPPPGPRDAPAAEGAGDADTAVPGKGKAPPPPPSGRTGASRRNQPRAGDDDAEDDLILETVIIRPGSIHENDEEE